MKKILNVQNRAVSPAKGFSGTLNSAVSSQPQGPVFKPTSRSVNFRLFTYLSYLCEQGVGGLVRHVSLNALQALPCPPRSFMGGEVYWCQVYLYTWCIRCCATATVCVPLPCCSFVAFKPLNGLHSQYNDENHAQTPLPTYSSSFGLSC